MMEGVDEDDDEATAAVATTAVARKSSVPPTSRSRAQADVRHAGRVEELFAAVPATAALLLLPLVAPSAPGWVLSC